MADDPRPPWWAYMLALAGGAVGVVGLAALLGLAVWVFRWVSGI